MSDASGATAKLAAFGSALVFDDLPATVVSHVKLAALDGIGCCLSGSVQPWTRMVADMVRADGGKEAASLFGLEGRVPLSAAVLVNSTAGHAFELDDIHRDAITHPNSIAVPVALNWAEANGGLRGTEAITAITAGYEIGCRVGAAGGTDLLLRGFHPQGTAGALVAAATAGRLARLDADEMRNALGIAGSLGAGLMAAQEGAMVKRYHSGHAAEAGVRAVHLAQAGFTGISNLVEADYGGFLSSFAGTVNVERATAALGTVWETEQTGFKPHATVTSIHSSLDALKTIMAENELRAGDIAKITASISHPTYVHCAWPYEAQSVTAAQMNIYYGLSVIALEGAAFLDQFREDRIADPEILDFIRKVEAQVDPEIEKLGPQYRHMSRVSVETTDGRRFAREERHRRGSPENPVSREDLLTKFRALAACTLERDAIEKTIALVNRLDELDDVSIIAALIAGPR
jgi:2-methylcitrate dehydratase PrpD